MAQGSEGCCLGFDDLGPWISRGKSRAQNPALLSPELSSRREISEGFGGSLGPLFGEILMLEFHQTTAHFPLDAHSPESTRTGDWHVVWGRVAPKDRFWGIFGSQKWILTRLVGP